MIDRKKLLLRSLAPILACALFGGTGYPPQCANAARIGGPGYAAQNSTANQSTTSSQTTPMTKAQKRAAKRAAKKQAKEEAKKESQEKKSAQNNSAPAAPASSNRTARKPSATTMSGAASSSQIATARARGMVWVNTQTRVYHTGGRYYGNTKHGQFMTLQEAQSRGYKAAKR